MDDYPAPRTIDTLMELEREQLINLAIILIEQSNKYQRLYAEAAAQRAPHAKPQLQEE